MVRGGGCNEGTRAVLISSLGFRVVEWSEMTALGSACWVMVRLLERGGAWERAESIGTKGGWFQVEREQVSV